MSIDCQDIPGGGGSKRAFAAFVEPRTSSQLYIDHLLPSELRKRANDDRADALALADQLSPEAVAMLLDDAERCERRAAKLDSAFSLITECLQAAKPVT